MPQKKDTKRKKKKNRKTIQDFETNMYYIIPLADARDALIVALLQKY